MRTAGVVLLLVMLPVGCHRFPSQDQGRQEMRVSSDISSDQGVPVSERVAAAKRKLRQEIDNAGLARVGDDLERLMMVSIRLKASAASEDDITPGSSHLGGTPDLPEGVAWPECNGVPMALLAQLRLQDVVSYDVDGRLPGSGMLYFFYEASVQEWGFDPTHRGNWQVIHYDGDLAGLRPAVPPDGLPEESRLRACNIVFCNEITLASWESSDVQRLNLSKTERDEYMRFPGAGEREETTHRLLGHPDQIQGEMTLECELVSNGINVGTAASHADPRRTTLESRADDWRLLLQIDSDEDNLGAMWGDSGRVYFWIRQQDLKERDFSNVWLLLQCY